MREEIQQLIITLNNILKHKNNEGLIEKESLETISNFFLAMSKTAESLIDSELKMANKLNFSFFLLIAPLLENGIDIKNNIVKEIDYINDKYVHIKEVKGEFRKQIEEVSKFYKKTSEDMKEKRINYTYLNNLLLFLIRSDENGNYQKYR